MDRGAVRQAPFRKTPASQGQVRGVYHVHTVYSGDSKITLKQVAAAARKARLDFVILTDHNSLDAEPAYRRSSIGAPPLMIFGAENTTPDGHLVTLGFDKAPVRHLPSGAMIDWAHEKGGYAIVAHPVSKRTPWTNADTTGVDGLEIYNFAHALAESNGFALGSRAVFLTKRGFLRSVQKRPEALLDYWDKKLESGKYSGWAAADAHIRHKWFGWPFENERMQFQAVTMVALTDKLEEKAVLEALAEGRSFIAFESRGPALGFSFTVEADRKIHKSGDSVPLAAQPVLLIRTPERARIVLVKDGATLFEYEGNEAAYPVSQTGVYRVEAYRDGGLWILSNPIYIE